MRNKRNNTSLRCDEGTKRLFKLKKTMLVKKGLVFKNDNEFLAYLLQELKE